MDGEYWGALGKVWLIWGLSGILVTDWNQVDPDARAIIQRTWSQLQMHKDKHKYIRERLLVTDRKKLTLTGTIGSIISPSNYIIADILNFNLADTNLGYLVGGVRSSTLTYLVHI